MERLSKLLLSFVDLAEVEVQSLKRGTVRLCFTIAYLVAGSILSVCGLILLAAAAYLALDHAIGHVAALSVVGGGSLLVGLGLLIVSRERGEAVRPATPASPKATDHPQPPGIPPVSKREGAADESSMRIAS